MSIEKQQLIIISDLLSECLENIPKGSTLYSDISIIKARVDEFIELYDIFKDNPYKTGN